jgi:hypothetical protein
VGRAKRDGRQEWEPNLAILAFQNQDTHWTCDPTLQYLQTKTKTHIGHGTQPCNSCIPKSKHILDMGPNLTILTFQTKTHIGLGTQQNAIFIFQTKTHHGLGTQQNAIFTFQLKHTMDLGPNKMHIYISS